MVYSKEAEVLLRLDGLYPLAASNPDRDNRCRASFPKDGSHQGSNFILISKPWKGRFIIVCEGHLNGYIRSGWKKYEG